MTWARNCLAGHLAGLLMAFPCSAEEVRIEHLGIDLLGNLEQPASSGPADGAVVLIVHGTLAHHGMELIKGLQAGLAGKGLASLAVTFSLGFDARRGMLDCGQEHDHRASDASDEIAAWSDWLAARGLARITLLGHSRGAEQAAMHVMTPPGAGIQRLVLVAPPSDLPQAAEERYANAFGGKLSTVIEKAHRLAEAGEDDTLMTVPGFLNCRDAKVTAAAFIDYYGGEGAAALYRRLGEVGRPILVVAAGADEVSPAVPARLLEAGTAPNVESAIIEGADHFFRDLFLDDLVERISAFLARPAGSAR